MGEGSAQNAGAGCGHVFAGEVDPAEAWAMLGSDARTALVDVRTHPEWAFVGLPDLSDMGKNAWLISWRTYPAMAPNEAFFDALAAKLAEDETETVLMLCRSGARSLDAARAAADAGARLGAAAAERPMKFWNVKEGFEGDLNEERKRARLNGWKARGLPWAQS